jgi:hypothetical protein
MNKTIGKNSKEAHVSKERGKPIMRSLKKLKWNIEFTFIGNRR